MKPLILLIAAFAVSTTISRLTTGLGNLPFSGNLAMCLMLLLTAFGHFKFTRGMTMMIPPFIPFKTALVYVTGVAEVVLGIALLSTSLRHYAGYVLIAFFILITPANIYAAVKRLDLEKGSYTGPGINYLWFRMPLQLFFIAWISYFSILL